MDRRSISSSVAITADVTLSNTEVAFLTRVTYDDADWIEPDSAVVEVIATLLGLIERSSFAAMGAFHAAESGGGCAAWTRG